VNVGAVVVGGDYQGLGIVRSLGRRGIPICVIDDEWSIARFSRYATYHAKYPDLRDPAKLIAAVLETGRRLKLDGWVLFPTREETVAAFSHAREELGREFGVPTPQWSSVQWVWDKRFTHKLAVELGIPTPRTWPHAAKRNLTISTLIPLMCSSPQSRNISFTRQRPRHGGRKIDNN